MEYLDVYDENKNYIGKYERKYVHENALWHNTVHCWLYDVQGNIYFQIRAEEGKLYTTASGHVASGETIKEAFGREVLEEVGVTVDYEKAELVGIVTFQMDKEKADGTIFRDRAFANVSVLCFDGEAADFECDPNEVKGLARMKAKDALDLCLSKVSHIKAEYIEKQNGQAVVTPREITLEQFLVNPHETAIGKYGEVLTKVVEQTEK